MTRSLSGTARQALVNVAADPIVEITKKGVRTRSREVELDVLILATGYDALTGALLAFDVVGRGGRSLRDKWRGGARSYLGFAMEGFPNLFAPSGPNGPAALANLITIAEHDVDWIADMIAHMEANGLRTVEPTRDAEDGWMSLVASLAEKSLIRKANTWWVGANVKGKPQGLTMFVGGFQKYRELCAEAAKDRSSTFVFDRAPEHAAA